MPALPNFLRGVPWMIHRRSRQCPSLVPAGPFPAVPAPSCASPRGTCSQMCTASLKTSLLFHNYCQQHFPYPHTPGDQGAPSEPHITPKEKLPEEKTCKLCIFMTKNSGITRVSHLVCISCCMWVILAAGEGSRAGDVMEAGMVS